MASTAESVFAWGKVQTDFNTEVVIADDGFRQIEKEGYDKPVFSSPNVSNAGYSTGSAYATKTSKDKDDVTFAGTERLTFQSLGFHAVGAFGKVGTPTTVVSGVYTQLFELLNPFVSKVLPARPLVSKVGEPAVVGNRIHDVRFPSMTFETAAFSSGDRPDLQLAGSWRGSGKRVNPSGVQFYGAGKDVKHIDQMTEQFVKKTSGTLTLHPLAALGGTGVVITCDFRDINITINENLNTESGYYCGGFQDGSKQKGQIRGNMPSNGQTVGFEATMILTPAIITGFDPVEKMIAGTEISALLKYIGDEIIPTHNYEATWTLNKAVIASAELIDVDGGTQGIRIVTEPLAVGNTMPLSLLLKTNVTDFNTYVG